jgi:Tfp pilus assembly protein PilV
MTSRIGVVAVLGFLVAAATQAQAMPFLSFADIAPACKASTGTEVAPNNVSTQVSCSATCYNGTTVSTTCTGTCTAVDANCAGNQSGWVSCNGFYTTCQSCPVSCEATNGTACSPNGSQKECVMSDNFVGSCNCFRSRWTCTL